MRNHNILLGFAALTLLESSATAASHPDPKCKKVKAEIVALPLVNGCTSAFGLCTAGTIDGNQGLSGTTRFVADGVTPAPATAPDGAATLAYSGIIHIATRDGTVDVRDTGIFDTASGTPAGGLFASFDRIDGGSGRFTGATGTLLISGKTIDGKLVADVSGEICTVSDPE